MNIFYFLNYILFFLCVLCVLCGANDFYELIGVRVYAKKECI